VTGFFIKGARDAYSRLENRNVVLAVLKSGSPSCGNREIYNGCFTGVKIPGMGVTAALLKQYGIPVFNENELNEADLYYEKVCSEFI